MVIQMPWLRWLPYFNAFFNRLVLYFTRFYNYFDENIHARIELRKSEKMRSEQEGKNATRNDFIEAFLSEIDNINENKETNRKEDKADEQYFTYAHFFEYFKFILNFKKVCKKVAKLQRITNRKRAKI